MHTCDFAVLRSTFEGKLSCAEICKHNQSMREHPEFLIFLASCEWFQNRFLLIRVASWKFHRSARKRSGWLSVTANAIFCNDFFFDWKAKSGKDSRRSAEEPQPSPTASQPEQESASQVWRFLSCLFRRSIRHGEVFVGF